MDPRLSPYSEVSKVLEVKQMIESMAADFTMEDQFIDDWFAASIHNWRFRGIDFDYSVI